MKIVVPIKQVASLEDDFELLDDGAGVDPDFVEWELNEWDAFSLGAALDLRDQLGGEVVALSAGGEEAESALRTALAVGADRATLVPVAFTGRVDPLSVASVLAAAIRRESPDLVLCGAQSTDAANGATGIAIAAHLDLPRVAVVRAIEPESGAASLVVERELEGGLVQHVRVALPALLTVQTGISEPRYANLRALKLAGQAPLATLTPDELGLSSAAPQTSAGARAGSYAPSVRTATATMLDGSAADIADRIGALVQERVAS